MSVALTVRFLTKRYIGEYDHQAGKILSEIARVCALKNRIRARKIRGRHIT